MLVFCEAMPCVCKLQKPLRHLSSFDTTNISFRIVLWFSDDCKILVMLWCKLDSTSGRIVQKHPRSWTFSPWKWMVELKDDPFLLRFATFQGLCLSNFRSIDPFFGGKICWGGITVFRASFPKRFMVRPVSTRKWSVAITDLVPKSLLQASRTKNYAMMISFVFGNV